MRTSHLAIKRRIEQEALKLTDAEVFASGAYSAYLTDMAEAATKRYGRQTRVRCYYDEGSDAVARTDNRVIEINAANFLTQSFPTRKLRSDNLVGLNGHEIGHILYTDFLMLRLYMDTLLKGRFYPAKPKGLSTRERTHQTELMEILRDKPEVEMAVVLKCAKTLTNVMEDVYVEARMCDAFPGVYRSGILLNNLRLPELTPSVTAQVDSGDYGFSIMMNLLIQYCKGGDVNNLHGYSGPYLDALHDCVPVVDDSVYDDDGRARYAAANVLLVKLWPFIREMIDLVKEGKLTLEQLIEEMSKQIVGTGGEHDGDTNPVAFIPLVKTDEIKEDGDGGVEYNRDYTGEDCASSGDDIARILTEVAEEKTYGLLEEELAAELQEEAERIRYGDAHKLIKDIQTSIGIGPRYQEYTFKNRAPGINYAAGKAVVQYVQAILNNSEVSGLYLCGKAGTGKTFFAIAVANYLIGKSPQKESIVINYAEGHPHPYPAQLSPVRFFSTADLLQRIRATYNFNNDDVYDECALEDLVEACKKAKLLILDDFGAEKPSEWVREQLFSIIEYRYNFRLPLIITSNLLPKELVRTYGERIADRIRECCRVVPLTGDSLRPTA